MHEFASFNELWTEISALIHLARRQVSVTDAHRLHPSRLIRGRVQSQRVDVQRVGGDEIAKFLARFADFERIDAEKRRRSRRVFFQHRKRVYDAGVANDSVLLFGGFRRAKRGSESFNARSDAEHVRG